MNLRSLSLIAQRSLSATLQQHGFVEIGRSCLFARRVDRIIHVIAFDKSRHGERVRVHIYPWAPEFLVCQVAYAEMTSVRALSLTWSTVESLGPYTIGSSRWWPIDGESEALASLEKMIAPIERGAFPWFRQFSARDDLLDFLVSDAPLPVRLALAGSDPVTLPHALAKDLGCSA